MTQRSIGRSLYLVLLAVLPTALHAQNATISGRVTDTTTSAPLSNATVRAQSGGTTSAQAIAGDDGTYRLVNLAPGSYDVVVTRLGYLVRRIPNVRVAAGQT